MKIAIIPARGGSKRIPRKNIKKFADQPMIYWSIKAAKRSNIFDRIIVSTDDANIAQVALDYGAEVPFLRPAELSDDYTATSPVIAHAINWCLDGGYDIENACCIYATAPFIQPQDLRDGLTALENGNFQFAFSVTTFASPIQRALTINSHGSVSMVDSKKFFTRSQDLTETYHDAGQFYWGTKDAWLSNTPIFNAQSYGIILPRYRVQDIDTYEDWVHAELLFEALSKK